MRVLVVGGGGREHALCWFLARSAQAVELDLSDHRGRSPVEIFGRSKFPQIGELSYLLTLAPRGFYWFQLVEEEQPEQIDAPGEAHADG